MMKINMVLALVGALVVSLFSSAAGKNYYLYAPLTHAPGVPDLGFVWDASGAAQIAVSDAGVAVFTLK